MELDAFLLNTQRYKMRIKSKWIYPGEGTEPSPTSQCSSYWKGSLRVSIDHGRLTYYDLINDMVSSIPIKYL